LMFNLASVRKFVRKGREAALMMMVMMAAPNALRSRGSIEKGHRLTGGTAGRAFNMATTMMARVMIGSVLAIKGRPLPSRDGGMGHGMMMLMQLMAFKITASGVMMMTQMLIFKLRASISSGRRRASRDTLDSGLPASRAAQIFIAVALMMAMVMSRKIFIIREGAPPARDNGARHDMMMLMMGRLATMHITQPAIGSGGGQASDIGQLIPTMA
jgi:hypothetical protein